MNHKQKLGYTVLGAVIMLVGLGIGAIVSPPLIAQRNGMFDKITCRELVVTDENGNKAIALVSTEEAGNGIITYNPTGEPTVVLVATEQQSEVSISNRMGTKAISLLSDSITPSGNSVTIYNQVGGQGVLLYSLKGRGNGVIVADRTGNASWTTPLQED